MTERVSKVVNYIVDNYNGQVIYENMIGYFLDKIRKEINDTISWSTFKKYIKYSTDTMTYEYEDEEDDIIEVYTIEGLK